MAGVDANPETLLQPRWVIVDRIHARVYLYAQGGQCELPECQLAYHERLTLAQHTDDQIASKRPANFSAASIIQ